MIRLYLFIPVCILCIAGCSQGTDPDPENDFISCEETVEENRDQEYNPDIPDNYIQYSDYSQRDEWGPYNVHDPSCIADDLWTWCYSTDASFGNEARQSGQFIQVRRSQDLVQWEFAGWAFEEIPEEAFQHVTNENNGTEPEGMWAPFIMKSDETYRLYYSVSIFGSNGSFIGLATSESPEGPWEDQGVVVKTERDVDNRNAIDPTVVTNPDTGQQWLAYGSFWNGIYVLELDPETGKPLVEGDMGSLIARNGSPPNAIEAPEIIYNEEFDKYYLFVSYGSLMDEYNIRVGRADQPDGPYIDMFGNDMAERADDFPVLTSPYQFKSHEGWQGIGHNAVFSTDEGWFSMQQGRLGGGEPFVHLMVMHLRKIFWNEDGWPVFSPQRYANVPQDGIGEEDISGIWEEVILEPVPGDGSKNQAQSIRLNIDGSMDCKEGEWELSGDILRVWDHENGQELELMLSREWDWERNRLTIVYKGLNDQGFSVWGKKMN